MPNALLVYPEFPPSYWGYNYALQFIGRKSNMPPLGLLTVAGLFPKDYCLKVVDMNVAPLLDADLEWADVVFTSTMIVQKDSYFEVVERCNRANKPVVSGGPHPTSYREEIVSAMQERGGWVDHFLFGEVEESFDGFLTDLASGNAKDVYTEPRKPDVTKTPHPRYDLVNLKDYGSMALQFSRGCPFDCEFCDITKLFGRVPRTKTSDQVLAEFNLLHHLGWRGAMFLVDDNFIGNKRDAIRLLPAITEWQEARDFPFQLYTETSVNLVDIPGMLDGMADAGFIMTFLGIESPNDEALQKTVKQQNTSKDESAESYLLRAIRTIQEAGLEATAGFIVGLDGDKEFQSHIDFIQKAGIPRAMAGLLTALKQTNLYKRLETEGRLLGESSGNNVSVELNFVPELDREVLIEEYKRILNVLYEPSLRGYFERCLTLFENWRPRRRTVRVGKMELGALLKSLRQQLFSRKQGPTYLWFLSQVLMRYPRRLPDAVMFAILGYHHEKVTSQQIAVDSFKQYLHSELRIFRDSASKFVKSRANRIGEIGVHAQALLAKVRAEYETVHRDFRRGVRDALEAFQKSVFIVYLEAELRAFKEVVSRFAKAHSERIPEMRDYVHSLMNRVHTQYEHVHHDFRHHVAEPLDAFRITIKQYLEELFGTLPFQIEGLD
jgi:radical SAM superfamily enzyme YgiQ (UPF0313 family)